MYAASTIRVYTVGLKIVWWLPKCARITVRWVDQSAIKAATLAIGHFMLLLLRLTLYVLSPSIHYLISI